MPRYEPIAFFAPGTPQPAGSKRALPNRRTGGMVVVDANSNAKPWQAAVAAAGHEAMKGADLWTGPLSVRMTFYRTRPKGHFGSGRNAGRVKPSAPEWPDGKPDVLKLARAVEDALTGIVWRDDAQIVFEVISKRWGSPGVRVHVYSWHEG